MWLILALMQVYWVVSILRQFRKYSRLPLQAFYEAGMWPADLDPPQSESLITGRFAIGGFILAMTSLILLPSTFVGAMLLAMMKSASAPPQWLDWLSVGAVNMAVLALGLSCAAALSQSNRRGRAIAGVVMSALVLIGLLVLALVLRL